MSINSIHDVTHFLNTLPKFSDEGEAAADFTLNRFKEFCSVIDDPQNRFPTIHVAGSNGKGSTCNIIASIYREAGHNVGVFSSPHLINFTERFVINGAEIREDELVLFFDEYLSSIKSFGLTYFEISTAIAFWWFARKNIDIAVIETGLGGRLDATNVITPLISVITSITLEHSGILGKSLQAIANEKGGIIKPGVPVVIGNLPVEAENKLRQIARANESDFYKIDSLNPTVHAGTFQLNVGSKILELTSQLQAPVQVYNIAVAWRVTHLLNEKVNVSEQDIIRGIEKTGSLFANRGRFERIHPQFNWYFDGAHNTEAIEAMKQAIRTVGRVDEAIIVLSLMKDKINKKMMIELLEFKKIVYYTASTKRGANIQDIEQRLPQVKPFPVSQKSRFRLLDEFNSELVIFGGSFYFYATVLNMISTYRQKR